MDDINVVIESPEGININIGRKDIDSSGATAFADDVLASKTFVARGELLTGTMRDNGAVTGIISDKSTPYSVPAGFHDGSGTVSLNDTEAAKLIPENIKKDVRLFGVVGSYEGSAPAAALPPFTFCSGTYNLLIDENGVVDFRGNPGVFLRLPDVWAPGNDPWEVCFKTIITQAGASYNTLFGSATSAWHDIPCLQFDRTKNKFAIAYPQSASTWKYLIWSEDTYAQNGVYYVKYLWDGTNIELYISTDGESWSLEVQQPDTAPCYQSVNSKAPCIGNLLAGGGNQFACGYVDLMHSYIKIGGTVVWGCDS